MGWLLCFALILVILIGRSSRLPIMIQDTPRGRLHQSLGPHPARIRLAIPPPGASGPEARYNRGRWQGTGTFMTHSQLWWTPKKGG